MSSVRGNLEKDERQQALLKSVGAPKEQKEVLTLKIWGEFFDEIVDNTLSLNTVASRYRYALSKLKEWVPDELEENSSPTGGTSHE